MFLFLGILLLSSPKIFISLFINLNLDQQLHRDLLSIAIKRRNQFFRETVPKAMRLRRLGSTRWA
jgi:hypothetical protein